MRLRYVVLVLLLAMALIGSACSSSGAEEPAAPADDAESSSSEGSGDEASESDSSEDEASAEETSEDASESQELQEVSLRLDWLYGSEHAPYFVAQEKGFFEEAGLDVTIREGEGSSVSSKVVGAGDDTFGVVAAGTVLLSVAEGIPIQAVATVFQDTPTAIIFPDGADISGPKDLEGKRLGVLIKSVTYNEWEAIADIHELDRDAINEVAMDRGIVEPMLADRIDAGIAWLINDGVQLGVQGQETDWIPFSELGLEIPSSTLVANTETIEQNPEMVEAFVGAVLRGWQYTIDNPDEAVEIFKEYAPDADPVFNEEKLPLVLDLTESEQGLGHSNPDAWQNLKQLYQDSGLLEEDIDLSTVYTNDLMPE